jgi:hypothetical protein
MLVSTMTDSLVISNFRTLLAGVIDSSKYSLSITTITLFKISDCRCIQLLCSPSRNSELISHLCKQSIFNEGALFVMDKKRVGLNPLFLWWARLEDPNSSSVSRVNVRVSIYIKEESIASFKLNCSNVSFHFASGFKGLIFRNPPLYRNLVTLGNIWDIRWYCWLKRLSRLTFSDLTWVPSSWWFSNFWMIQRMLLISSLVRSKSNSWYKFVFWN